MNINIHNFLLGFPINFFWGKVFFLSAEPEWKGISLISARLRGLGTAPVIIMEMAAPNLAQVPGDWWPRQREKNRRWTGGRGREREGVGEREREWLLENSPSHGNISFHMAEIAPPPPFFFCLALESTLNDSSLRRKKKITAELPYSNCLSFSYTEMQKRCLSSKLITTGKIWKRVFVDSLSVGRTMWKYSGEEPCEN